MTYKNKPKIIFAGTAEFACPILNELHENFDIILVLTQPQQRAGRGLVLKESAVDLLAQSLQLPILRPESIKKSFFQSIINNYPCDFLVVAAYGKIIPKWLLDWPKYAPLNVHGSLLPAWRGAAPVQHSILNGDKETGATIIHMTPGLDEGPIYAMDKIHIEEQDDHYTLTKKISTVGSSLLIATIASFPTTPKEQEGVSSYAPKILKTDGLVLWNRTSKKILDQYRAFKGWPGLFCFDKKGQRIKINNLAFADFFESGSFTPGETKIHEKTLLVKTKDSWLKILNIQFEGKKDFNITDSLQDKNHWLYHNPLAFNHEL
ncbi:methionyl-tRNA formyltransferase [bacterium]|nr:methionyl-tRNA formyltransferase [bacterium]NBX71678.1 methionyl-tRNA formyltransferase [bacterium]